jgi:hypothetical protein
MNNIPRFAVTLLVALVCAASAGGATANASGQQSFRWLTGTWRVQVATYNCQTGVTNPPFASVLTFDAFGNLTGTTANAIFLPGQRSPDHGVWKRVGWNYFSAASEAYIQFSTPATSPPPRLTRGVQRIEQGIEMTGPDSFTSEATLTFFDEAGAVVLTGCAKATAQRFH